MNMLPNIKLLRNKSIAFYYLLPNGNYGPLSNDNILRIVEDEEQFLADVYRVTKEHIKKWMKWRKTQDNRCRGVTRKGKRCKITLSNIYLLPNEFIDDEWHDYCDLHLGQKKMRKNKK